MADRYRKIRKAKRRIKKYKMKGVIAKEYLSSVYRKIWKDAGR